MTQKQFEKIYTETLKKLDNDVRLSLKNNKVYGRKGGITKAFDNKLRRYNSTLDKLENEYLTKAFEGNYKQAVNATNKHYNKKYKKQLTSVDKKKINQVRQEYKELLKKARSKTISSIKSDLKRAGNTKKAVQLLNKNGISTFKLTTKSGKVLTYELEYYSRLITQYSSQKARDYATINTVKRNGEKLVKFSSHGTICVICGTYAEVGGVGRVYTLDRKDTRYPYLYDIPTFGSGGWGRLHPNCKHWLNPYSEVEATKEDEKRSNLPFTDQRDKKSIEKYDKKQEKNRKKNYIKKKEQRKANESIL